MMRIFNHSALIGVLAVLLLLAIAWPAPAAAPADPALKSAATSARVCPGMHAEWLDEKTVQCMKEVSQ